MAPDLSIYDYECKQIVPKNLRLQSLPMLVSVNCRIAEKIKVNETKDTNISKKERNNRTEIDAEQYPDLNK